MRKFFFILLFASITFCSSAKLTQFLLRGDVREQDYAKAEWRRQNLDSIFVSIVKNDTVAVDFKLLTGDNELKFSPSGEIRMLVQGGVGKYTLLVNKLGYEPLRHDFNVASEGQDVVYLRSLYMERQRQTQLQEVEIVGTAIKMVMKGDTIVYDSAAFNLPEGSTLEALVSQLPNATLNADGSISVNGRKVTSLLLDGNDFFKGDPDVALKNLPSYTVSKIKVYDKAAEDDYLTHKSHTITDDPTDDNLVMDVILKKEFAMATLANVEGGYGPGIHTDGPAKLDHRYLGRAFFIGFGKNYRWSVFGNANNVKNTSRSSSSGKDWTGGWNSPGEMDLVMGGIDLFYKPIPKLEMYADLQYSHEDIYKEELKSMTRFYDSGNIYTRSRAEMDDLRKHLMVNANIRYRGDNIYVNFSPSLDYMRVNSSAVGYGATLSENPHEDYAGAAIDSIFHLSNNAQPSAQLSNSVMWTLYEAANGSVSMPNRRILGASLYSTYSPKELRGQFGLNAYVRDQLNTTQIGKNAFQTLSDPTLLPERYQLWANARDRVTHSNVSFGYNWSKSYMNDTHSHSLQASPTLQWNMERTFDDQIMRRQALFDGFDIHDNPLPSVLAPDDLPASTIDPENTRNYLSLEHRVYASGTVSYRREVLSPCDSALNLNYTIGLNFEFSDHIRHLSYDQPYLSSPTSHFVTNRNDYSGLAGVYGYLQSSNKQRYISLIGQYYWRRSTINMLTLAPIANTSDPLNIYLGVADGIILKSPNRHDAWLRFTHHGNRSHSRQDVYVNYTKTNNAVAQASTYNPITGVTTYTPVNVNGNWNINGNYSGTFPFGVDERWSANFSAALSHNNSVDFLSISGAPVQSVVRSESVNAGANLSYSLKSGTRFYLGASTHWQYATSPRIGFKTISATNTTLRAGINFFLPYQIEGETSLNAKLRRGYEDSAMNTNEWIWNATIQKSILKGALTFKLTAVDLLGQFTAVNYSVNAQGRTETWVNDLPRYAMFTISYRFSYTPKVLK